MELFANRIHRAAIVGNMIRLEFSVVRPDADGQFDAESDPAPGEEAFAVSIPVRGFLRSMGTMRDIVKDLNERGMLQQGAEAGGKGADGKDTGTKGLAAGRNREMPDLTKPDDDEQLV